MRNKYQTNDPTKTSSRKFIALAEYCTQSESPTLFSYLALLIRRSRPVLLWERYVKYIRRFRALTTALRLLPWILLLISTHTLLYAAVLAVAILCPIVAVAILSLLASTPLRYREVNRRMASKVKSGTVYVLFPERNKEFEKGTFWHANLRDLASGDHALVVIVSPFLFSSRGLYDNRPYVHMREECGNVFLVRRHYFFSLRKHVLLLQAKRLILIY